MKICWDNLEGLWLTKNGNFRKESLTYEIRSCANCNEYFLAIKSRKGNHGKFCNKSCANTKKFNPAYGKIYTSKEKRIIAKQVSKALKGKYIGENHWLYGKKRSPETIEKMRNSLKGRKKSVIHRKKLSESKKKYYKENPGIMKGELKYGLPKEKNPNWKGGIFRNPYCSGWNQLTNELKESDNYKCLNPICEGKSKRMTSHHIDYDKQNCHPDNIITLCNSCNVIANYNREWWQSFYTEIKRRLNCD